MGLMLFLTTPQAKTTKKIVLRMQCAECKQTCMKGLKVGNLERGRKGAPEYLLSHWILSASLSTVPQAHVPDFYYTSLYSFQ